MTAQTVGLYGLYHPDARQNPLWIFAFIFATMYQFTWDIFMDWDLVRAGRGGGGAQRPAANQRPNAAASRRLLPRLSA